MLIAVLIAIYIALVFGLSRLIIPYMRSGAAGLPEVLPDSLASAIQTLTHQVKTKEEFLALTYNYIGAKYRSERFNTVFKFSYLFLPLEKVWEMSGYMPCTQTNFLLSIFLVKSGFFKEEEIKKSHVPVNFVPHQYLIVRLDDKWVSVDVGEKQRGMPIGKHLKYFG